MAQCMEAGGEIVVILMRRANECRPGIDPKRFEVKTERVTWNGKTFNVYPGRT